MIELELSAKSTENSDQSPRSGVPRSLDLTIIGLALILDQFVVVFYTGGANLANLVSFLTSLPVFNKVLIAGYFVGGIVALVMGLLWRPPEAKGEKISLGIKAYSLYTGLSLFALVVWISLPSFKPAGANQGEINAFLAAMLIVVFGAILYVLSRSLWAVSNTARWTAIGLYAFVILLTLTTPSSTSVVPGLVMPAVLIWYMFRNHVKTVYSPPPPPEAANYVLRTRVETRKCANCGFENDREAKVCEKCSAPLVSLTTAGGKAIGTGSVSLMVSAEEELRIVEDRLSKLLEFKKSHTLLNQESYDGLVEMNKKRLEELRAMVPVRKPGRSSKQT